MRKMKAVTTAQAAVLIVIIVIGAGVGFWYVNQKSPTPSQVTMSVAGPAHNQTVVVDMDNGEPDSLDVAYGILVQDYGIEQNMYQGLVWFSGNVTTEYVGVLATNWTISPDGLTYTFSIRHNVQFSNGRPFDAYAVWFNFYRLELNNGPPGYILGPVSSGGPWWPGPVTLDDLNTFNFLDPTAQQLAVMNNPDQPIQVADQYTVVFHLQNTMPSFLARLALCGPGGIEDPTFVQEHGGVQTNATLNEYVSEHGAPGTGPYMLDNWIHGQSITLKLNPYFWGPTPYVSKVIIQYKSNSLDAINDLKTGAVQMLYTIPFNLLPSIQGSPGIIIRSTGVSYDISWINLVVTHYPLNITNVRLAINYAINKDAIIQNILHGYGATFQGPVPRGMFGYNSSIEPIGYDPAMAKQLLAQAGFPGGAGIKTLSFIYYTEDPVVQAAVQAIQSDLAQIGITVNLQGITKSAYFNIQSARPLMSNYPDIFWDHWSPDYPYPDDYAWALENGNALYNNSLLNDTLITQWTNEALINPNPAVQLKLYSQVQQREKELSDNVWLWQSKSTSSNGIPAYRDSVQNVYYNPMSFGFNYSSIYIQPVTSSTISGTISSGLLTQAIFVKDSEVSNGASSIPR